MGLSAAQKAKLKEQGFSAKDIKDFLTATTDDGDGGSRRKPKKSGRVVVLEGKDAEGFLAKFSSDDDEDDDEEDDDDDDEDATPPSGPRYFRSKK
jgi:hypothetical protein